MTDITEENAISIEHLEGASPFILDGSANFHFDSPAQCYLIMDKHRVALFPGAEGIIEAYLDDDGKYRANHVVCNEVVGKITTESKPDFTRFIEDAITKCETGI